MPFHFPQRNTSKITHVFKQIELHLSDRQSVLNSHSVAWRRNTANVIMTLESTLELATMLVFTAEDIDRLCIACLHSDRDNGLQFKERLNICIHMLKCTHIPVEFSRGGSHAPWMLVLSRGVNKSSSHHDNISGQTHRARKQGLRSVCVCTYLRVYVCVC